MYCFCKACSIMPVFTREYIVTSRECKKCFAVTASIPSLNKFFNIRELVVTTYLQFVPKLKSEREIINVLTQVFSITDIAD